MGKNRIILIVLLILVIVAAGLFFTNSYSTLSRKVSNFSIEDTASIAKLFIADKNNNEVTLSRSAKGEWLVDGKYAAQQAKINSFLKTLTDLEVKAPVPIAGRNNVITRMAVIAKKIEIYQVVPRINLFDKIRLFPHEKLTKTYYVGDVTPDNQGTFMLMEGSDEPFIVYIPNFRGFVSSRYSTVKADWRDFTVFRTPINKISSVRMEFPGFPGESYAVEVRDNQNIVLKSLADNTVINGYDTLRMLNFLTGFEDIRFESLLEHLIEKEFIDSVRASIPKTVITLTDREGRVNQVKIFNKKGFSELYFEDGMTVEPYDLDRAYALVNEGQDFVLIQYFVFDRVTRGMGFLTGIEE